MGEDEQLFISRIMLTGSSCLIIAVFHPAMANYTPKNYSISFAARLSLRAA